MADQQLINQITELDFLALRDSFKNFLRSQTNGRFTDFDFEGSNLAAVLDLLAYHTHYDAFYLNMHASERSLNTSVRRNTTVARAKDLGYLPRSAKCASATIPLITPVGITIPTGTQFQAQISGKRYTFQTIADVVTTSTSTTVTAYEGRKLTSTTTMTTDVNSVTIPNANVDTSLITVTVSRAGGPDIVYERATDIVNLTSTSLVYFIDEVDNQRYKIYFGDDILGAAVVPNDVVTVNYIVSSLDVVNGANSFTMLTAISGVSIDPNGTIGAAAGGAAIETLESIKLNAPLFRQTQGRATTPKDYVALVNANFGNLQSVIAWGGEDNNPVALGYVFISVKPTGRLTLTEQEKFNIESLLKTNYCDVTVDPICVDPTFLYIKPSVIVKYKAEATSLGPDQITSEVSTTITNFSATDLEVFGDYFRYSKFVREIDATDIAITNSLVTIKLENRTTVSVVTPHTYELNYYNAITPLSVRSATFSYTIIGPSSSTTYPAAFIKDDGAGAVKLYYITGGNEVLVPGQSPTFGTVDYINGVIQLNNFMPDQIGTATTKEIRVDVVPSSNDIYPVRNVILLIDPTDVSIVSLADVR